MTTTVKNQRRKSNNGINGQYLKDEQQPNNGSDFNHFQLKLPDTTSSMTTIPPRLSDNQSIDYNSDSDVAAFMRRRKFAIDHHQNKNDYLQNRPTPSPNQEQIHQLQQNKSSSFRIKEQPVSYTVRSHDEKANHSHLASSKRPSYEEHLNQQGNQNKVNPFK